MAFLSGLSGCLVVVALLQPFGGASQSGPDSNGMEAVFDADLTPVRKNAAPVSEPFDPGSAPFSVVVRGDTVPSRISFVSVLPGDSLVFGLDPAEGPVTMRYSAGRARPSSGKSLVWHAPTEPGTVALRLERGGDAVSLNAFVLHPSERARSGTLNGYRIGKYSTRPLRGDSVYLPPPGFIEVSPSDQDILVSPHFTVGQFLCK